MTAPISDDQRDERYSPSKPGDSLVLERLARQAQEGVSIDDARELVLRAYMAGFAAGVGEYVGDGIATVVQR
jgi:hypothetical protein